MTATESILLGILSGILSFIIIGLLTQFIRKVVIPWYQHIIYDGVDISGDWKTIVTNPSGNMQDMKMEIKQRAGNLHGIITIAKKVKGTKERELKTYSYEGDIRDRFVTIFGKNTSKRNLGVRMELLEVIGNGESMKGYRSWYSITDKIIRSEQIEWHR